MHWLMYTLSGCTLCILSGRKRLIFVPETTYRCWLVSITQYLCQQTRLPGHNSIAVCRLFTALLQKSWKTQSKCKKSLVYVVDWEPRFSSDAEILKFNMKPLDWKLVKAHKALQLNILGRVYTTYKYCTNAPFKNSLWQTILFNFYHLRCPVL